MAEKKGRVSNFFRSVLSALGIRRRNGAKAAIEDEKKLLAEEALEGAAPHAELPAAPAEMPAAEKAAEAVPETSTKNEIFSKLAATLKLPEPRHAHKRSLFLKRKGLRKEGKEGKEGNEGLRKKKKGLRKKPSAKRAGKKTGLRKPKRKKAGTGKAPGIAAKMERYAMPQAGEVSPDEELEGYMKRISTIITSKKKKEKKAKKSRKKAAAKAWRTRRKKLTERIKELEAKAKKTEDTKREIIVLKEKLRKADRIEFPKHQLREIRIIGTTGSAPSAAEAALIAKSRGSGPIVIRENGKPEEPPAEKGEIAGPIREIRERTKRIEEAIERRKVAQEIEKEGIPEREALEGRLEAPISDDEKASLIKRLMKRLEYDYYKRHISEDQYKKMVSEYKSQLAELEEKKKIIMGRLPARPSKFEEPAVMMPAMPERMEAPAQNDNVAVPAGEPAKVTPAAAPARRKHFWAAPKVEATEKEPAGVAAPEEIIPAPSRQAKERGFAAQRTEPAEEEEAEAPAKGTAFGAAAGKKLWAEKTSKASAVEVPRAAAAEEAQKHSKEDFKSNIDRIIEAKAAGKIDPEKIDSIEGKINQLLDRYNIPEKEIADDIQAIDKNRILKDFDKLIDLIELEHKAKEMVKEEAFTKIEPEFREVRKKKEEIRAIAMEITKHRIVTDFDKVLTFVKENGKVSQGEIIKAVGIKSNKLDEILNVLEENELLRRDYPPIGPAMIFDVKYKAPVKEKGKKPEKKGKENEAAQAEKKGTGKEMEPEAENE